MSRELNFAQRRRFLQTTGIVLGAAASGWRPDTANAAAEARSIYLVDKRFAAAQRSMQQRMRPDAVVVELSGDVTPLWRTTLKTLTEQSNFALSGTTTESVCFCLEHLVARHRHLRMHTRRLNRDLFEWEITHG